MTLSWIEDQSGTVGLLDREGMLGKTCTYRCWLFNVFDASGNLIYVEGSDLQVQQGTASDCKWLCEYVGYAEADVAPKAMELWSKFFPSSMAGKGPTVRAKVVRHYKSIAPEPEWACFIWDGVKVQTPKDCTIYGRSKQVVTTTQAETPCPPYYKPVTQPDGTFKCVEQTCPPGTYIVKNPDGTARCVPATNVFAAVQPNIPRLPFAPGQTVVTTPPGTIPSPPIYRVAGTLGSLSDSQNLQAKALLQIWLKNNPSVAVAPPITNLNYGSQPADHTPVWGTRDGWVLSAFSVWWSATHQQFLNPGPGIQEGYIWTDLTQQHADAVNAWAVENGFLPPAAPGETPLPNLNLPFPLPAIPTFPPNGWTGQWPPTPPSWFPPVPGMYPPIGQWGVDLPKPPGWDLTGIPWPPPTPGVTPGFPGTWPTLPTGQPYPFPIPKSAFVQGGLPPPPNPTCPTGQVWDGVKCQPLPPPPSPKPAAAPAKAGIGAGTWFLIVFGVLLAGMAISSVSEVGAMPGGRDEDEE